MYVYTLLVLGPFPNTVLLSQASHKINILLMNNDKKEYSVKLTLQSAQHGSETSRSFREIMAEIMTDTDH